MRRRNPWKTLPTRLELVGLQVKPETEPGQQPRSSCTVNLSGFMEVEMPGAVVVISVETEDGRILDRRRIPIALFDDVNALRREYPAAEPEPEPESQK